MENQHATGQKAAESSFFKKFLHKAEEYVNKPSRIKKLLTDAYKRASEQKDLGTIANEVWESFQQLYRMIRAAVSGEYHGIEKKTLVGGVAVLLYLVSPIDLIPDFIPVLGMLDDAALLAWFLTGIKTELDHFLAWETAQSNAGSASANASNPQSDRQQTEGSLASNADPSSQQPKNPNWEMENNASGGTTGAAGGMDEGVPRGPSATGAAPTTGAGEPHVRANTTDSTRIPSSNSNDATSGGNVR